MSKSILQRFLCLGIIILLVTGCIVTPTPIASRDAAPPPELSKDEIATLNSLKQVTDYPLYTMHYYGAYAEISRTDTPTYAADKFAWACSLFAALGDANNMLYGRNFDWNYSPAVLLFTSPPDGYASVSIVDIAYLGFATEEKATALLELPLAEREALLAAPHLPFDGMNEHGLAIGMAAVPETAMPHAANKETIGSLGIIREMLDHARDVDEAVAIMRSYNIDMEGGPSLHYLLADATGNAVLVEFDEGEMLVMPNEHPWHLATNFLRFSAGDAPRSVCPRYAEIDEQLTQSAGHITTQEAMQILEAVSQPSTQWSVVYEMSSGGVNVVMGREYGDIFIDTRLIAHQ